MIRLFTAFLMIPVALLVIKYLNQGGFALKGRTDPVRYKALIKALDEFKFRASADAKRLKSLAENLTFQVEKTSLRNRRVGAGISFGGGIVASVAGIAGLLTTSPLILPALLLGSAISGVGFVVSKLAEQDHEESEQSILVDVEHIFEDLVLKGTHLQNEIKHLADMEDDNKVLVINRLVNQLREDMKTLHPSDSNLPPLENLLNILENLRKAYSKVTQNLGELAFNAREMLLVPIGLSQTDLKPSTLLDIQKQNTQFASYGPVGKVVHMVGLFGNLAATGWSIKELNDLTDQLSELETARNAPDMERIYRGVAASLHRMALDLEDVHRRLSDESLQL